MKNPFFSIVIPTYNRAAFVEKTINSALNQSYSKFEIIVVDDGSTDNTSEIVRKYINYKVKYFKIKNSERGAARNHGAKNAAGDYITFLDSDDILYPDHLQEASVFISSKISPEVVHLGYEILNSDDKLLYKFRENNRDLNRELITGNSLSCMGVFVRKDIILQHPFREDRELSGSEDWELWMRLASRFKIHFSEKITSALINHEDRSVLSSNEEKLKKRIDLAISYLNDDPQFVKTYGKQKNTIKAHLNLYIALHLILSKDKTRGLFYFFQAILKRPNLIFTRKTLAILKHSIF